MRSGWWTAQVARSLLLRAARLDFQPLWWDEGYSVWFAHQPLGDMLRLTALDIHPPLYYALLGGWSHLFGLGPVALRWLSVAAGVAAVPLIYLVGYWLSGRRVGLAAAFLLAINPLHIYYSQEVRMYALVALWSLLAIGTAGRWLGLGRRIRGDTQPAGWGWLAGYVAAITLALYSQYYAAFLLAGLAVAGGVVLWRRRAGRERSLLWLAAQGGSVLLFLPWILYAAPKLVPYVSQKIVADSDQPLGLLQYLARHLAAYSAGHLEGPLAGWWPLGLLGVILLAIGLIRLARRRPLEPGHALVLSFLAITLSVVLGLGWLVNLGYPFFPDRGERLLLLGLPAFILLLAATWVAPDPVRSPGQRIVVLPPRGPLPRLFVAGLALLAALSLAAFYTVPRYADEDYRPLIGQVTQWGRAEDTVFAVYPWQVGYFWSYGLPNGPRPELAPAGDWGPEVATALDDALSRGRVWLPMHLSLGGLLESAAEQHLAQDNYQLTNRWYSPSTRLTGWAAPQPAPANSVAVTASATFDGGVQADVSYIPQRLSGLADPEDGRPIGLLEPAGQGNELALGEIDVQIPGTPPPLSALPMERSQEATLGDAARLLGYSATPGPLLPGNDLMVNLFWQALPGAANSNLSAFVQLLDRQGQVAAGWEGPPVPWRPTGDWQPGELLRSQHTLRLPATLLAGRYSLVAGLFDPATGERLPATWQGGPFGILTRSAQQAELGQIRIQARKLTTAAPEPRVATDASLERLGRLVGYDLANTRVAPGDALDLTLHWQPTETTGERLTVFVHLLDEQGMIVGQSDGEPAGGSRPTSSWLPDEFIADRRSVRVQDDALLGSATLLVGLYDPATGQRVSWIDAEGQITGDALRLPTAVRITTVR